MLYIKASLQHLRHQQRRPAVIPHERCLLISHFVYTKEKKRGNTHNIGIRMQKRGLAQMSPCLRCCYAQINYLFNVQCACRKCSLLIERFCIVDRLFSIYFDQAIRAF